MSTRSQPESDNIPPTDGSLPAFWGTLDWQAEYRPSAPWAIFPSSDTSPAQLKSISFLDLALASHRVAHALRPGRTDADSDGNVIALLLHCDTVHYDAVIAGCLRAGLVPFPMSPRNTPEAVVDMLEKTKCHRLVSQSSLNPLVKAVQETLKQKGYPLKVDDLLPLEEVFPTIRNSNPTSGDDVTPYPPPDKKHQPDDIVLYLHSSGSTGIPKAIPLTQKVCNLWMGCTFAKQTRVRNIRYGLMGLPAFHAMGLIMQFIVPLVNGQPWVAYEPKYPAPPVLPTPHNTLEVAKLGKADALLCVPTFIEAFAASEESIDYLKTLKVLLFGGGPLSEATGLRLEAAGIRLVSCYGGTEWGPYIQLWDNDSEDPLTTKGNWRWMGFPDDVNIRWVPQGDGTFELHFLTCPTHQPAVENLLDTKGYATSDLFIPHPNKPGLWRIIGRADDVIILGSGEKIVPLAQENYLSSRPMIQGAVMFGRARNEPGVLLEPKEQYAFDPSNEEKLIQFRNLVWPFVEEANKLAPAFGRIFKEMIIVTHPDKPMGRAGKGTVLRKQVLNNYESEINALYDSVQSSKEDNGVPAPQTWSVEETENWLVQHATIINNGIAPAPSVDLFEQGFDSLSATFLRNRILGSLRSSSNSGAANAISQEFIFAHPTIKKLAEAIHRLVRPSNGTVAATSDEDEVLAMIDEYSSDLPEASSTRLPINIHDGIIVLLTGSTGGLGSHLLATLLEDPRVKKVYTFDRGENIPERQRVSFEDRGIPGGVLESVKLVTLEVDYGKDGFGLSVDVLSQISKELTHIVHNAWKVDFNLSLSSFSSNVRTTRRLLDFASSSAHQVRFVFCSSVSAASRWDPKANGGRKIPEEVMQELEWVGTNGYARSKYVAERVLSNAGKKGHAVTTLRIGQIAGSEATGAWNASDWVPNIIKSSVGVGCLPDLPGDVSWFSMDTICHTILDVLTTDVRECNLPELINVVHPRPRAWHAIMEDFNFAFGDKKALPLVPFHEWLAKVEERAVNPTESDLENVPGIKLLGFLQQVAQSSQTRTSDDVLLVDAEGIPKFDTAKAQSVSRSLKDAEPLSREQVGKWLEYWCSKGFIQI